MLAALAKRHIDAATTVDLRSRESFAFWTRVSMRFADIDELGHANNIAMQEYAETARVDFRETVFKRHMTAEGRGFMVVNVTMNFVAEARYPGTVEVGTLVLRIGNTSYSIGQGLFKDGRCIATCETTTVHADLKASKSLPLPAELRQALERYRVGATA